MKSLWHFLRQRTWLMALPLLLLLAHGSSTFAAQAPSYSAITSGTTNNLTVVAHVNIADAEADRNGNYYLGLRYQQAWFFNNGTGWLPYAGGTLPVYAAAALANRTIEVVRDTDVSGLIGGELYVGYGSDENDMLTNAKYGLVYSVTADTTAPSVVSTLTANGATAVAINAPIGATFSEAMAPSSINAATVELRQGTTPILGTVSYVGMNLYFVPENPLASSTSYSLTIKGGSAGAKDLAGNPMTGDHVLNWTTGADMATTAHLAPVLLGGAGNFAILAKTGISSVPTSVVTGNIGVSPAAATYLTGFSLSADASNVFATATQVVGGGKAYAANYAVPTPANLTTAVLDMQAAYTDAAGRPTPDHLNLGGGTIGGLTLAPGLYKWGSSVMLTTDVTLAGGANDVWIFQMSGNLIVSAAKRVILSGGAQAKNIFWQVAGQATLGTTAHVEGIVLSQTGISLQTGATLNGRALAQSLVTLDSASVTQPAP